MILIVDDQPENIYSLRKLLESKNFAVDSASSGEEALKKILRHEYVLIILDVQMPGMDGFEVAETISGYSKTKDIPIIFLSAVNTDKHFIARGYESGAIDYVTKPVDPDILLLKVKTFFRLYEQTRSLNKIQDALRQEIETRKEAQAALKERVDHLHTTLSSLPQIAFTATQDGTIDFVNQQWFHFSDSPYHFPATCPEQGDIVTMWEQSKRMGIPLELEVQIKPIHSDNYRFHLLRIIPIKENDAVVRWVGTFTDIDDQKQIEKKKDEFLSIASHELKTPLTSIRAYAQLLERAVDGSNKTGVYIGRVQNQLQKLESLVTDLLDISKIEHGKLKISKKNFDFEIMLSHALETIYHTYGTNAPLIERTGDRIDILLEGDEIRIEQVVINYLTNAIKYSPNAPKVLLNTRKSRTEIKVSVTDFGIGIPKEKQANIFNKFYRVEESSVKFQGLGIGLYICSDIIRQHGGTFGLDSAPGEGSTFYFTIPLNELSYA